MTYHGKGGSGGGGSRRDDPPTSKEAAGLVDAEGLLWRVLLSLRHGKPRNGWEISRAMGVQTITAVPRLAPLRRQHAIQKVLPRRPGPTGVDQSAYVITATGHAILRHEIELQTSPPREPWERLHLLQSFCLRALDDGLTAELRDEIAEAFATFGPGGEEDA
jgi:hypothetical protein